MRFKKILKILLISIISFFLVVIVGVLIYTSSAPELSAEAKSIIREVVKSNVPEIIEGETGFAINDSIQIWYESLQAKDSEKATILLFMGISNDALAWPDYFIQPMVDSGYQVIRFDYRGTGLSDWMENWSKASAYSLTDIAEDGIAILDELQIKKAHLIGLSMGGMVAQEMLINYPERVLSLTSIMSSGYIEDPELHGISINIINDFIKLGIKYGIVKSEINSVKLQISARQILMGEYQYKLDYKKISEQVLYNIRNRNGYNPKVSRQHTYATSLSGSRYPELEKTQTPTLIIHGKSDPLIPIEHGIKCSEIIPHEEHLWIKGMGHDIPAEYSEVVLNRIFCFYKAH
ncbi:MAG: alpha/beta hydrolase, partial [Bacteroidales bacterium]|nr:alpha/beta hydrolase [Bacteroidales bacterium]